ncbi:MAG: hypothetical protein JWP29_5671 [Rhodoferax sp.]|nr:hypothetical protein [Rhodoferax sp.]
MRINVSGDAATFLIELLRYQIKTSVLSNINVDAAQRRHSNIMLLTALKLA